MNNINVFSYSSTSLTVFFFFARRATINFSRRILFCARNLCEACDDTANGSVTSLYTYVLCKEKKDFYEVNALRRGDFHPSACCTSETVERTYMKLCSKRYNKNCKKDLIFVSYDLM
jgi:hypothetical protein